MMLNVKKCLNNQSLSGKQFSTYPSSRFLCGNPCGLASWAMGQDGPRWAKGLLGIFISKAIVIVIITIITHGAPALEPSITGSSTGEGGTVKTQWIGRKICRE